MNLLGRKIVITGATGGIGNAVARALASRGCHLLLTGRDAGKLEQLSGALNGSGHRILAADLNSSEGQQQLYAASKQFGVDTLINGLGISQLSLVNQTTAADIEASLTTNLMTPINICTLLLPLLQEKPNAAIINIGSILGSIGCAGSAVYCASKFGLRGFTEALRREMADSPINIIYFAPRATNTPLNSDAMQKMNEELGNAVDSPDWVASELVKVLEKEKSSSRYLGWPESLFVRINAVLPRLVDNALSRQLATIKRHAKTHH